MPEMSEWLTIKRGAIKGEHAKKRLKGISDFKRIREILPNEEGVGSTSIAYEIAGLWVGQTAFEGKTYQTLEIPGAGNIEIEGAPELPQEGLFVAIPENADVAGVVFSSEGRWKHRLQNPVRPVSKPVRRKERPEYNPDPRIYEPDRNGRVRLYPPGDSPGRFIGTKRIAGRKVAHIMLYPVQYEPKLDLVAHKSIQIKITYRKEPETDRVAPRLAPRRILQTAPTDRLILDSATQLEAERELLMREPESLHCSNLMDCKNECEYLIITTRDLKDSHSLDDLVTAREDTGQRVMVVTKEEILKEFRESQDESECDVIFKFLRYARKDWKKGMTPQWVILAGDTKDIPTYHQDSEQNPNSGEPLASDHFYADLWDDLAPDLVVSRLPTSDPGEMASICGSAKASGGDAPSSANEILFMTYGDPDDIKTPARISCAREAGDEIDVLYNVTRITCTENNFQGGQVDVAIAAINGGSIGLVNYLGHGWWDGWHYALNKDHLSQLRTGGRLPVVFSLACDTNCIDYDETANAETETPCFGERWVREGKAVAFLGPSRSAYSVPDLAFQRFLFDAMMPIESGDSGKKEPPLTRIGDIMNAAKAKLLGNSTAHDPFEEAWNAWVKDTGSPQVKDNIRMYLLLGDPCATFGGIK
jgi:hypothetical protein